MNKIGSCRWCHKKFSREEPKERTNPKFCCKTHRQYYHSLEWLENKKAAIK